MGRFANKVSAATKQRSSMIKVNPYELPEKALAVIANICTKQNKDDASIIFDALMPVLYKEYKPGVTFFDLLENYRSKLYDVDFISSLNSLLQRIELELSAHENTNDTQVVVAGGFSAGKSSFLNSITGAVNLLPTDILPTSMISTYLYFSNKVEEVVVKGVNFKDAVVLLDKDVLQCIQHSSSSKVYLASVINKLFVEMPSEDLKGLVFIDTPGYNNSDKANDSNGQSDQDTATDSFKDGNVLFWVVDIKWGAVPKNDKAMINQFLEAHEGDGKVVIIFNKADQMPESDIKSIVDMVAKEYALGSDQSIIDVLAYSCENNKIHYSKKGYTMPQLLNEVRKSGNGNSSVIKYLNQIEELFENEKGFAQMIIEEKTQEKKERTTRKDENYQFYIKDKEGCKEYMEAINDIMVKSYDEVMNAASNLSQSSFDAIDAFKSFFNGVMNFENNDHWGSSDILNRAINSASSAYDRCCNKHNAAIKYQSYYQDYRKEWADRIKTELDRLNARYKEDYELFDGLAKETTESITEAETLRNGIAYYQTEILDTLKKTIREFQYGAHKPQDARLPSSSSVDIFTAISSGNYGKFMDCFTHGVSLNTYSADGFSPLTYAVKEGAAEMVRFFISHNADITALDKNGFNAFHVAALYGYRNICDLLLKEEPTITNSMTSNGKTALQLAEENTFTSWFKSQI